MNRCAICNRFKKWEELEYCYSINYIGTEDEWYECFKCIQLEGRKV